MEDEAMEDEAMEELPATVVDIAAEAGSFTTLLAAAEAAGLVETLTGEGPLTVFAPTDDAFAAALADLGLTAEQLLADTDTLTSILTYHVVAGQVLSTDL
ncbi:MAG: fasciclin domain-containing protein, partial [Acidimicrobiales bacterium]